MTMETSIDFDETQKNAIRNCCNLARRVVAVTGEAGTGKTTILQAVYNKLRTMGKSVVLCAPTGKAAKRIQEATGIEACTIHRLLEYPHPGEVDPETGKTLVSTDPKRDKLNPIPYDVVLCDEYAMVNMEVDRNLFDALPPGGSIRMFGDANQLQPIESNKRLQAQPSKFIRHLEKFDGIRLTTIHRQSEGNVIIENGHRILNGVMPKRTDTYVIKFTDKPVETVADIVMSNDIDFKSTRNQMITPTKVGWVGTEAMNGMIQGLLHDPTEPCTIMSRHPWVKEDELLIYVGDKVLQTRNQYALNIFNGETGIVQSFDELGTVTIDFGDKIIEIPAALEVEAKGGTRTIDPQKDLDLAYVITTHKTQGSEYEHICYVMNRSRSYLLNRKNLYTGQSRARESVMIVTDQKAMQLSLAKRGDK